MTQAVILAGGLGTRLWPLTKTIPKPMVPLDGVPYLEHQLCLLRDQSITDIVLLIGYLGEQIEDHFGDGSDFGLAIRYSHEHTPLGTGGALQEALDLLDDSFLVIYGDSYLPIQYGDVLNMLTDAESLGTEQTSEEKLLDAVFGSDGADDGDSVKPQGVVTVYDNHNEDTGVVNNIALDDSNYITKYNKDNPDDPSLKYVEAGVLALKKCVVEQIPEGKVSLEQEIFPKLIADRQLLGFVTTQRFYDIGTPERLERIAYLFQ